MMASDLVDIEEIKQLKARYCRLMDQKQWDDWGSLFTHDAVLGVGEGGELGSGRGPDEMRKYLEKSLEGVLSSHTASNPEVTITGPGTASGTWSATFVQFRGRLRGYGFYDEEYRKEADAWKISRLRLTATWVEGQHIPEIFRGSAAGAD